MAERKSPATAAKPGFSKRVDVLLRGNDNLGEYVTISPASQNVLGSMNTAVFDLATGVNGTSLRLTDESLCPWPELQAVAARYHANDASLAITYPGLADAIIWKLHDAGIPVGVNSRPTAQLPQPDLTRLNAWEKIDSEMLHFINHVERGLVRYGAGVDPAILIAQVALAYPEASIVVPVVTKDRARAMAANVQRFLPDAVCCLQHGVEYYDRPRVIVTLPGRLGYGHVAVQKRDILLTPDPLQMLGKKPLEGLRRAFNAHVIGYLPLHAKLSASDWDRLRCWYGFAECVVPAHGRKLLPIRLVIPPFHAKPTAAFDATPLKIKQQEIWRHQVRNRLLCECAQAIHTGERSGPDSFLEKIISGPQRVAVVVENVEHASELLQRLTDWPLLTGAEVSFAGLPPVSIRRLKEARKRPVTNAAICTYAAAGQMDYTQLDVLIRADGGTGLPPGLDGTTMDVQDQQQLLLIDFYDRQHPICRQWSNTRKERYAQAGWYPLGTDAIDERCKQFFVSRPSPEVQE